MSESTNEQPTEIQAQQQGDPAVRESEVKVPEQEMEDIRRALAKANKEAEKFRLRLKEQEEAGLSDLEKAQREAKEAQEEAARAPVQAFREAAVKFGGISREDAELFLTGADVETLEKQAARLMDRTTAASAAAPRPDLSQGGKGTPPQASPADSFAAAFEGRF